MPLLLEGNDARVHTRGLQFGGKSPRLVDGNECILCAMKEQERRRVLGHVGDRRGASIGLRIVRVARPEERDDDLPLEIGRPIPSREIGGPKKTDHGLDPAGFLKGAGALESVCARRHAKHRGQMCSRGKADDRDSLGIDPVLGSMRA